MFPVTVAAIPVKIAAVLILLSSSLGPVGVVLVSNCREFRIAGHRCLANLAESLHVGLDIIFPPNNFSDVPLPKRALKKSSTIPHCILSASAVLFPSYWV